MTLDPATYQYRPGLLRDRVILVTGASSGIGRALARQCALLGARVILHGRNTQKLEAVHDELAGVEDAPRPSIAVLDLATADGPAYVSLAERIDEEFGRLDGLVQNAGVLGQRLSIEQYDLVEWQRVLHINLTAAVALAQVCLPLMKKAEDPSMVFTSSGVGRVGKAYWGAYSVSKFGVEALSQILADENRHVPLRVNAVNPGATRTDMRLQAYPAEDREKLKTPEQVLRPFIYLLGPDGRDTTGRSLDSQP